MRVSVKKLARTPQEALERLRGQTRRVNTVVVDTSGYSHVATEQGVRECHRVERMGTANQGSIRRADGAHNGLADAREGYPNV